MLGSTEPFQSEPGNNHGDFFVDVGRIIYHGSASVESANVEIAHWFPEQEQITWGQHSNEMAEQQADPFAVLPPVPEELSDMYLNDWKNCTDPTEKNQRSSWDCACAVPGTMENFWNTI